MCLFLMFSFRCIYFFACFCLSFFLALIYIFNYFCWYCLCVSLFLSLLLSLTSLSLPSQSKTRSFRRLLLFEKSPRKKTENCQFLKPNPQYADLGGRRVQIASKRKPPGRASESIEGDCRHRNIAGIGNVHIH